LPYSFIYDITHLSQNFFFRMIYAACNIGLHKLVGSNVKKIVRLFRIDEATGLNLSDAIALVEDLIEVQVTNKIQRKQFENAKNKAVLLPHCARAYMDRRCMADFDPNVPTYKCKSCNPDCIVSKAITLGKKKGYDVYVIPGGSCAEKILRDNAYGGVVGVACADELKLAIGLLKKLGISGQGVFLTRNGCSNTNLSLDSLRRVL
jgi:hypothetical protein